ncbi:Protein of unknown function [Gryllus bimaculatus]|nr:Protein of unknown function [Gryllus bimaculatus]
MIIVKNTSFNIWKGSFFSKIRNKTAVTTFAQRKIIFIIVHSVNALTCTYIFSKIKCHFNKAMNLTVVKVFTYLFLLVVYKSDLLLFLEI